VTQLLVRHVMFYVVSEVISFTANIMQLVSIYVLMEGTSVRGHCCLYIVQLITLIYCNMLINATFVQERCSVFSTRY